jgi:hypothetical protein
MSENTDCASRSREPERRGRFHGRGLRQTMPSQAQRSPSGTRAPGPPNGQAQDRPARHLQVTHRGRAAARPAPGAADRHLTPSDRDLETVRPMVGEHPIGTWGRSTGT